jgi:hypothetical protein
MKLITCQICNKLIKYRVNRKYCADCADYMREVYDKRGHKKHTQDKLVIRNVLGWSGMDEYRKQCERTDARYQ